VPPEVVEHLDGNGHVKLCGDGMNVVITEDRHTWIRGNMNFIDTLKTVISTLEQRAVRDEPKTSPRPRFDNRADLVDAWMKRRFSP